MTARRRTSASPLLAGWLFADLLLGVTIIMLGAQAPPPSHAQSLAEAARPLPEIVQPLPETEQPSPDATRPPAEKSPTPARPPAEESLAPTPPPAEKSPAPARPSPPGPSPTPFPCTGPFGDVQAKPITISFQVAPGVGDGALASQVRQELLKHRDHLAGQHAGMVLTFGADGAAGDGVRLATRVNTAIREAYPRIFGTAVTRNFHDLAAPSGSISMEIYLMTYGCSPAPKPPKSPDE